MGVLVRPIVFLDPYVPPSNPTLVAYSKSNAGSTYAGGGASTAIAVAASFTWAAGDVIVVASQIASGIDVGAGRFCTLDAETNITWTANGATDPTDFADCVGASWTGVATGAGSGTISGLITNDGPAQEYASLQAWHFTNTAGVGNKAAAAATGTTPTQALTVSAGSAVVTAWADWNATGTASTGETNTGTLTEREDAQVGGAYDVWGGDWNGVSAGADNWGTTSGAGRQLTFSGTIEVLGP
jgi:hypothetical protein